MNAQLLSWEYEDIFTDTRMPAANPSMAVDADQNVHLSFWNPEVDRLEYAFLDRETGVWSFEVIAPMKSAGYVSSLVLDDEGGIHVAFLENISEVSYVGYANKLSGEWTVEEVLPEISFGKYGLDLDFPIYAQPTISLQLTEDNQPLIIAFDGTYTNLSSCNHLGLDFLTYRRNYQLDLKPMIRDGGGTWQILDEWNLPYINGSICLTDGDRFGEYAELLPPIGGRMYAIAPSVHNHQLYLLRSAPDDLSVWDSLVIEDVSRYETINPQDFRETFDYLDVEMGDSGLVHMAYGVSDLFGFNGPEPSSPATSVNKRRYFYASFHPDSLEVSGYTPFYRDLLPVRDGVHRKHFSLTTKGNDSIWLAYYQTQSRQVLMDQSTDGGLTWTTEEVLDVQAGSPLELSLIGDTLFLLAHDRRKNQLYWSKKEIGETEWITTTVNTLEERAKSFQSVVNRKPQSDDIYAVYNEENSQNLLFASRVSGIWEEEIIRENESPTYIQTGLNQEEELVIAYLAEKREELTVAFQENDEWVFQVVNGQAFVRDLGIVVIGDSIHLSYYDLGEGALTYARGELGINDWDISILDESSPIIGTGISMNKDSDGGIHLSYVDVANNFLKYAYRNPQGSWSFTPVTQADDFDISQTYLAVDSTASPVIVGGDGLLTSIFLFQPSADTFSTEIVISGIPNFQGGPLEIIIDPKNRPWILYNFSDISTGLRLLRRGPDGIWNPVSVLNNQGQIGNVFDFHLVEEDFYIIGRKNKADDEGIALLFATEGVTTDISPDLSTEGITVFPNPADQQVSVTWEVALTEETELSILDMQGRNVIQPILLSPGTLSQSIDVTSVPMGIYLISIRSSESILTKKLLINP
ncbi:MAG: T9SS type A sorting domain-containing protein [Bacteroidota bacterium]